LGEQELVVLLALVMEKLEQMVVTAFWQLLHQQVVAMVENIMAQVLAMVAQVVAEAAKAAVLAPQTKVAEVEIIVLETILLAAAVEPV
jgi:hypothetical protein